MGTYLNLKDSLDGAAALAETHNAQFSLVGLLKAEGSLLHYASSNLKDAVSENLKQNWPRLLEEAGIAFVAGAALARISKNPAVLGGGLTQLCKLAATSAPVVFGMAAVADVKQRLIDPSLDLMHHPGNLELDQRLFTANVASMLPDYLVMSAFGVAGAKTGFALTAPYINSGPDFDMFPSRSMAPEARNRALRVSDPGRYTTQEEFEMAPDVVKLYEESFPVEERQPTEEVKTLVGKGRIRVITTRDPQGHLAAFHTVSMHDGLPWMKFAHGDFLAVQPELRSGGLGSLHYRQTIDHLREPNSGDVGNHPREIPVRGVGKLHYHNMLEIIRESNPDLVAFTGEMESPDEPGLDPDTQLQRNKRKSFYDALDKPSTGVKWNILDFNDPKYRGQAKWTAVVFKPERFFPKEAAHQFLVDEGGYQLSEWSKPVREFVRANNYYRPLLEPIGIGICSTAVPMAATWQTSPRDAQRVDRPAL